MVEDQEPADEERNVGIVLIQEAIPVGKTGWAAHMRQVSVIIFCKRSVN